MLSEFVHWEPVLYLCRWPGSYYKEKKPFTASVVTFVFGKYAIAALLQGRMTREVLESWYDGLRERGVMVVFFMRHGKWKRKRL